MSSQLKPLSSRLIIYLNLIRWDRPAGWLLLLWPTLQALWLAAGGFPGWHLFLVFIAGTILMRSAGCCINDVADSKFDIEVKRTARRPLAIKQISKAEALLLALVLVLIAFILALTTNLYVVLWSVPALLVTIIYPWSKRWLAMPQAVLGMAFSFGIPMAFAACRGSAWLWLGMADFFNASGGASTLLLVLANLFWVLAYDTEYAMVDRDDDLKIGIKTSAITLGNWDVTGVMLCYLLSTLAMLLVLQPIINLYWLSLAMLLVLGQILWHWRLIYQRDPQQCFVAFSKNHWLGFTWFAIVALALCYR